MLTAADFAQVDIYGAFSKHMNMGKKQANTHGGEWWSDCPFCGTGRNRFHMWPYRDDDVTIHYWCRVCGESGDIVAFVEWRESRTFFEACEALNIDLGDASYGAFKRAYRPNDDEPPPLEWRKVAHAFAVECKDLLWSEIGRNALNWLRKRGLSDETIRRAGLGYNPTARFDDKMTWGVDYLTDCKKIWLPRGIVIPWLVDGMLWKLTIRRPDPDIRRDKERGIEHPPKYVAVKGGSQGIYGIDRLNPNKPTLIVEGEFDKLIAEQEARHLCTTLATGSTTHGRGERWALLIAQTPTVLIGYDADGKGEKAASDYWLKYVPQSLYWQPWAKDVNEMFLEGNSIQDWIALGIEIAHPASVSLTLDEVVAGHISEEKRIEYIDGILVYVGFSDAEMRAIWLAEARRRRPTWDEAKQASKKGRHHAE